VPLAGAGAPEWIPIAAAAALLGCSARTIERHVSAGAIEARALPRAGRRPERLVLQRDVEALLPPAFVAPAIGGGAVPEASAVIRAAEAVREAIAALQRGPAAAASPAREALFVSLAEASELTGLSRVYLAAAIARGELASVRDGRRVRIRRRDLAAL